MRHKSESGGKTTMEEVQVKELYELSYSDLLLLSSSSCSGEDELSRIEGIMETLGPNGPGLLAITHVPNASLLRRNLLLLAPKLALLPHNYRKRLLKEHNLGTDVSLKNPNRQVSSFAMQLKYEEALESVPGKPSHAIHLHADLDSTHPDVDDFRNFQDNEFQNLSNTFKELGYCMMDTGLRLAQICDKIIGGHELEKSLLESGTAKGRLIHYHSVLDNLLIRETGRKNVSGGKLVNSKKNERHCLISEQKQLQESNLVTNGRKIESYGNHAELWQQWHYDYGIFTVLTAPMFLLPSNLSEYVGTDQSSASCDQECPYPNGYSYLQIYDPNKNTVFMVKTCPESFIIQVGESADILSKGKLRSTLHCVSRPVKSENISRETFVVFLQPAWNKAFSVSDNTLECSKSVGYTSNEGNDDAKHNSNDSTPDFHKIIPPLTSRLRDGMTFAEFSRETTKQYYGGSGLQSNR